MVLYWLFHLLLFCLTDYSIFYYLQDFDLCVPCFNREKHPHKMDKLGLDIDDGTVTTTEKQANPQVRIAINYD